MHNVSNNMCHFYFWNNFMKHWQILINFGMQHHEESET